MNASPETPTPKQVRSLPADLTMVIPPEWEDRNGHVNVQYYQALYELGGWQILEDIGIDADYLAERKISLFDVEHHVCYLAEMHVGETVSVFNRMLGRGAKRFHGMLFILNDSRQRLACTIEYLSICIDLSQRRAAAFPMGMAGKLDTLLAGHDALEWPAPVCGILRP